MPACESGIHVWLHIDSSDLDPDVSSSNIAERKVRAAIQSSLEKMYIRTLKEAAWVEPVQVLTARAHGYQYDMETLGRVESIVAAVDRIARRLILSYQELPSHVQKRKPSKFLTELVGPVLPLAPGSNVDGAHDE